jgi:hypothetical protein
MQHANPAQFAAGSTPSCNSPPRLDPDHPDADILEAYEGIRAYRVKGYANDDAEAAAATTRLDPADAEAEFERTITGTWATTPAGIAARLLLAMPEIDQSRWLDRDLAEHGLFALYQLCREVDFSTRLVITAAYELLHVEWQTALSEYERSAAAYEDALGLQALIGEELRVLTDAGVGGSDALVELAARICTGQISAQDARAESVTRLVRTLAPDLGCYRRKIEAIQNEGVQSEAVAWLARDANFLFATFDAPAPHGATEPVNG